jgi:hypothetical protein
MQYFAYDEVTRIIDYVLRSLPEGEAVPVHCVVDHAMRSKGLSTLMNCALFRPDTGDSRRV